MKAHDIIQFAKDQILPIKFQGSDSYRCAARLTDGTFLPCVMLASLTQQVDLAIRRFDETRPGLQGSFSQKQYRSVVAAFVAAGNSVNWYDLDRIELSPYAIALERLREIVGETLMSWTEFTVVMDDGREFTFGTRYLMEFFEMPEGYTAERIVKIVPHEIGRSKIGWPAVGSRRVYRERPYFICYLEGL